LEPAKAVSPRFMVLPPLGLLVTWFAVANPLSWSSGLTLA